MIWILLVYFLFSFIVMDIVKPWKEEYPFVTTLLCFIIGGAIFVMVTIKSLIKFMNNKD